VGRSDNDRQLVFLNGRPVDLPQVGRSASPKGCAARFLLRRRRRFLLPVLPFIFFVGVCGCSSLATTSPLAHA
jgi:hypothetical protein